MWSTLRNIDGTKPWPSFEAMENETDGDSISFIEELITLHLACLTDMGEKDIRAIARSSICRMRWNAFKDTCTELFGHTSQDMSNDQFMLVYWSQMYDSVYESYERPPDDVINNDEALDKWLLEESENRKREIGQKWHGRGTSKKSNSKIDNAAEVYKVVDGQFQDNGEYHKYTPEERMDAVEKIKNLNSPTARKIKSNEEKRLRERPNTFVQEHELRKNKSHREAMGGNVTIKRSK